MWTANNTANRSIELAGSLVKPGKFNPNNPQQVEKFMVDLIRRNRRISRFELNELQSARYARHNADRPVCYRLQEIYKDALLDGHLTAITENRTLRTANKSYCILDLDGKIDDERTKFLKKRWFFDLVKNAHESVFHGVTVALIKEVETGNIKEVIFIPREHINQQTKVILKDVTDENGLPYKDYPMELLECIMYDNVGLLEKACAYTILKRHSWGSWDEFEELFGIPIRIAKVAANSDSVKREVASWLEMMGSASYGVFPTGTEVEIKENSKADAFNVFFKKLETLDKELSKLILHQTMTTDSGSSRSQGEVHESTLNEVVLADESNMIFWLNDNLLPVMRYYGYDIPEDYSIGLEMVIDPNKKILIDKELFTAGYVLKKDYIEEMYGVEVERMPTDYSAQQRSESIEKKKS